MLYRDHFNVHSTKDGQDCDGEDYVFMWILHIWKAKGMTFPTVVRWKTRPAFCFYILVRALNKSDDVIMSEDTWMMGVWKIRCT